MSIDTATGCGPHCGIASGREGHCDCGLCHDGSAPIVITREDLTAELRGTPMCALWYDRAGAYRPWHDYAPGCTCGASAHALPEQHGEHCPVYQLSERDRAAILAQLAPREPVTS